MQHPPCSQKLGVQHDKEGGNPLATSKLGWCEVFDMMRRGQPSSPCRKSNQHNEEGWPSLPCQKWGGMTWQGGGDPSCRVENGVIWHDKEGVTLLAMSKTGWYDMTRRGWPSLTCWKQGGWWLVVVTYIVVTSVVLVMSKKAARRDPPHHVEKGLWRGKEGFLLTTSFHLLTMMD